MRNFTLTLLAMCFIATPTFADCPTGVTVKDALDKAIDFNNLGAHMGDILKNNEIDMGTGIEVFSNVVNKPLVLVERKTNTSTNCVYKVMNQEVVSFYLKD